MLVVDIGVGVRDTILLGFMEAHFTYLFTSRRVAKQGLGPRKRRFFADYDVGYHVMCVNHKDFQGRPPINSRLQIIYFLLLGNDTTCICLRNNHLLIIFDSSREFLYRLVLTDPYRVTHVSQERCIMTYKQNT
jgi:hypothetical protein